MDSIRKNEAVDRGTTTPDSVDTAPPVTVEWPIHRYRAPRQAAALHDLIVQEQRVELVLNGNPVLAMLTLPRDIEALAMGFLVSEGLWRDRGRLPVVHYDVSTRQVRCEGAFDDDAVEGIHRRWTFGTGCGGGGTARDLSVLADCRPVDSQVTVSVSQITELGRQFGRRGELYKATGGVHACGIADPDTLLLFAEDVGRHNAFDKVAGMALRRGLEVSNRIALTTGRLSAEIVAKAIAHRIPILVSSSAPTSMGVQWSRRFGMTLVGFLRGKRMNVYTGYQRIVDDHE